MSVDSVKKFNQRILFNAVDAFYGMCQEVAAVKKAKNLTTEAAVEAVVNDMFDKKDESKYIAKFLLALIEGGIKTATTNNAWKWP